MEEAMVVGGELRASLVGGLGGRSAQGFRGRRRRRRRLWLN
jgi:hypothetical protein